MRELNVMEVELVSGAGLWSAVTSSVLGVAAAGSAGAVIGGMHGGDGGGILGFGAIGQGVGMVAGGLIGAVAGGVGGFVVGWNTPETVTTLATQWVSEVSKNMFN